LAEERAVWAQGLDKEVGQLRHELEKSRQNVSQLEQESAASRRDVQTLKDSASWRLTKPLRIFRKGKNSQRLREEEKIISQSGLFDRYFYLERYPDVATSKIDPIRHYILHGAAEGRDPSADFKTEDYLRRHPHLGTDPDKPNPLVHFIRSSQTAKHSSRA